jgi:hypothetical protein
MAMAIAQQLNQHATAAQMAAPKKSLYEILSRDRERIAAADLRNQQYVLDQKAAQKQRAKEQHAAQEQATAVATAAAANSAKRPKTGQAAPASAGSVYVTGVPAGASWTELEDHFGQVGPVQRVKLYKDANGATKGDALVVYQKEASVLGATQLLNGKPPSPRCNPATRRDATLRAAFLHATVRVCYEPPATACGQPAAACHLQARCCGRVCPSRSRRRSLTADPHRRDAAGVDGRAGRRGAPRLHRACTAPAPQLHLSCTSAARPACPARPAPHLQPICSPSARLQVWLECCLHGEVQRIVILRDFAAVRFASVISAAAAVDALDGRFFAERTLKAEFDDGTVAPSLPSEHDTLRQDRFGFGEMAQAYRDSHRTLSLAAAEGAPLHRPRPVC